MVRTYEMNSATQFLARSATKMKLYVMIAILCLSVAPLQAGSLEDSMAVLGSVGHAITKAPLGSSVVSQKQAGILASLDKVYHGFGISGISVYRRLPMKEGENIVRFEGILTLENELRRRALVNVGASYSRAGNGLKLEKFEARTVAALLPTVDIFFVPEHKNQAILSASSLSAKLAQLVENASTPDEISPFEGRYHIYAALRDRLDDGASLWVTIDDVIEGNGKHGEKTLNYNYSNWQIASNAFSLTRNAGPMRYIKVFLKPGLDTPPEARVAKLIFVTPTILPNAAANAGKYVNRFATAIKNLNIRSTPSVKGNKVGQLRAGNKVGIVASSTDGKWAYIIGSDKKTGYVFAPLLTAKQQTEITISAVSQSQNISNLMSLSDIENVHKVHMRLATLRFYRGKIDSKWTKASRTALRKFKVTNGLEDSAVWDVETQEVLFP